jgi:UDP-2-acetamido-3-amino-2,3-dideoxy-glucuronate N-acetyltransferase
MAQQGVAVVRAAVDNEDELRRKRREVTLDRMDVGLHIPPLIWGTQYRYTADAVLFVLASHPYDPADYIRSYDEFRALCGTAVEP